MPADLNNAKIQEGVCPGYSDTRQRILEAAIQLFSENGYTGATTRSIAAAAGVNEVTLFRHFGNKENLLREAINEYSPLPDLERIIKTEFTGNYHQDLLRLGHYFLARLWQSWQMVERRKIMMMTLLEVDRRPEMRDLILPDFQRVRHLLKEYLQDQIDRGHVRDLAPEVMVEAILGMFLSYALLHPLLAESSMPEVCPEELVAQFVNIFGQGTINQ
jgi:AcrR family transcriptional regulator